MAPIRREDAAVGLAWRASERPGASRPSRAFWHAAMLVRWVADWGLVPGDLARSQSRSPPDAGEHSAPVRRSSGGDGPAPVARERRGGRVFERGDDQRATAVRARFGGIVDEAFETELMQPFQGERWAGPSLSSRSEQNQTPKRLGIIVLDRSIHRSMQMIRPCIELSTRSDLP